MFDADGVVWGKRGEFVSELAEGLEGIISSLIFGIEIEKGVKSLKTYPAYPVVFLEIRRFLDHIPPNDSGISMIVVRCIGRKVHLSEELLLMML